MAKKSKARKSKARKKRRKAARRQLPKHVVTKPVSAAETEPLQATSRAATRRKPASVRATQPATIDYAKEYSYVYADLKRVAVITAAMLVILVVLSFIIT